MCEQIIENIFRSPSITKVRNTLHDWWWWSL